LAFRHTG